MSELFVPLGPVPADEACAQAGDENYTTEVWKECNRFIALLRDTFGEEPVGALLCIQSAPHDFGTYYEVVCYYDPDIPASVDYAFRCEREAPTTWTDVENREAGTEAHPPCPECGNELTAGTAFSTTAFSADTGYLCTRCRMLFAHDLTFLATYVG